MQLLFVPIVSCVFFVIFVLLLHAESFSCSFWYADTPFMYFAISGVERQVMVCVATLVCIFLLYAETPCVSACCRPLLSDLEKESGREGERETGREGERERGRKRTRAREDVRADGVSFALSSYIFLFFHPPAAGRPRSRKRAG
jgi:hypothetical protein